MPMNVPITPETRLLPGFTEEPCCCVLVCGKAIHDCSACGGTGVVGAIPIGVWEDCRKKGTLPEFHGDPRFDPRAESSARKEYDWDP
jgi:hypothetical protein